jgi:DNA-binding HxlR family transcriptional regulator
MQNFHHINVCPIRDIISRISSKWAMLVLVTLHSNGTMRFNDIQKSIGEVSQRMLTVTLRSLEADGLIHRKVYPEVPPKVEYKLSERGESLMPLLQSLIDWALEHADAIMEDRNKDR